jgi:hypothetical protein
LLAKVKRKANRLYLIDIELVQPTCFVVCGRGNEVA